MVIILGSGLSRAGSTSLMSQLHQSNFRPNCTWRAVVDVLVRIARRRIHADWPWKNRTERSGSPALPFFNIWLKRDARVRHHWHTGESPRRLATVSNERSAACPSGEGAAALLGGLASCFAGYAEALLEAGTVSRGTAAKHCHGPPSKSLRFSTLYSSSLSASLWKFRDLTLIDASSNCRTLAKCYCRKLCIFLVLQMPVKRMPASTRDTVPSRNRARRANAAAENRR